VVENLAEEWDKPSFTMEQKQAAIAQTLTAVIVKPASRKAARATPIRLCRYPGKT
jgi:site-specific DNA recombinase